MANYKASILSQSGKSYKIEVKKGSDVNIFYRSYTGTDKINQDMQALEDKFNDANKKAERDAKKQARKDQENVDKLQKEVDSILKSLVYSIPKSANSTQVKLDKLKSDLQAKIDLFIGGL